jgi:hypothetical protein
VPVRAVGGSDDVPVFERAADTDGDSLLADGYVKESWKLAGAEALLHFLFETADEEHLAQELLESLVRRHLPLLLQRGHAPTRYQPGS